ncbi:MAG: hypothetical protein JSR91_09705 [Proteobacteria bacterium]|nr:hypothetical protein [Pseudomonadota bacterium]
MADEVRHIKSGDFVFVPRNAVHRTVSTAGGPIALLSILTPQFDRAKDVVRENGVEAPWYAMVWQAVEKVGNYDMTHSHRIEIGAILTLICGLGVNMRSRRGL